MKLKKLIIFTALATSSAFSAEIMNNVEILEHKSEVIGKSKNIEAISGRLGNGPIIYKKQTGIKSSSKKSLSEKK